MAEPLNTIVSIIENERGKPNIVLEGAKFWGRPNFRGEQDRFKDERRKFTVLIPNEAAEKMREIGYNVRTTVPTEPEEEPISSIRVFLNFSPDPKGGSERGPDVFIIQGGEHQRLTSSTIGILDSARIMQLDMEFRGWEYDPEDSPGALSARLVKLIAVIQASPLDQKYGILS